MPTHASLEVLYLLLVAPLLVGWVARTRLAHRYELYSRQPNRHFADGLATARHLLTRLGLTHVGIERVRGRLADHYDPLAKVLRLSPEVAAGRSIASIGIVAHEVGHAHQDATGYPLLGLQQKIALYAGPFIRWGGWFLIGGIVFGLPSLVWLAGIGFAAAALAGLLSVPVERDASRRAMEALRRTGLADEIDLAGVREVLSAAAFTYLAGLLQRVGLFLAFLGLIEYFDLHL